MEKEVEGYIDNLFKNEMEKRVNSYKNANNMVGKKSSDYNPRTIQSIQEDMVSSGMSKKSKFISKNIQNAKNAVERYEKDQKVPGDSKSGTLKRPASKK